MPVNVNVLDSIRKAQDELGLPPHDAHTYVTRLLGTGMDLDEINRWIASGTETALAVLNLKTLGVSAENAGEVIDGDRLGEKVSDGYLKTSRQKRARSIYANAPFEIIGEAFADHMGSDSNLQDIEPLLMRWSNEASRWLSGVLIREQNVPQRSALPLAMSIILTDADELVGSCVERRPLRVRHLDRDDVQGFIEAMKPLTDKILNEI